MNQYKISCPYCGAPALLRPASTVYGYATRQKGSYLYLCANWPACDSYVGAHKKDKRPMGTLADKKLRHKRILAHQALERVRKDKHMEKWGIYLWLQGKLQLNAEETHIGLFSEDMCDQVIALCNKSLQPDYRKTA